jgi:hypothetical protein
VPTIPRRNSRVSDGEMESCDESARSPVLKLQCPRESMTGKRNSMRVQDVDGASDVGCAVQNATFVFSQRTATLLFPVQIQPHVLCSHVGREGGVQRLHKMQ